VTGQPAAGRIEQLREQLPGTVAKVTQVVVDNPGQFALITAGTVVLYRAALNLVRPRTPLEAAALLVVLQIGLPKLAMAAVDRGWLTFRIRDADGRLIPLITGKVEGDGPVPAP
jgi:hypothetical protein